MSEAEERSAERREMVEVQLRARGIADPRVLEVMGRVPRHRFVDASLQSQAYEDHPLPIGYGQTISQPYMVARMTELCELAPTDRVLEVGAGSGYQTAVLASLCRAVFATEIVEPLAERAIRVLTSLGLTNATVAFRDGSVGWAERGPFDAILVAAGAPGVPPPLEEQLAEGGRLVIPVGDRTLQVLRRYTRQGAAVVRLDDTPCRFVELHGRHGWTVTSDLDG